GLGHAAAEDGTAVRRGRRQQDAGRGAGPLRRQRLPYEHHAILPVAAAVGAGPESRGVLARRLDERVQRVLDLGPGLGAGTGGGARDVVVRVGPVAFAEAHLDVGPLHVHVDGVKFTVGRRRRRGVAEQVIAAGVADDLLHRPADVVAIDDGAAVGVL